MKLILPGIFLLAILGSQCSPRLLNDNGTDNDKKLRAHAARLSRESVIVDTHIDYPMKQIREYLDPRLENDKRDFDIPRAKQGGLNLPFFAVYISPRLQDRPGASREFADSVLDTLDRMFAEFPEALKPVGSAKEFRREYSAAPELIYVALGIENASPIEEDLEMIETYYQRGVRYMTLCHGRDNLICDSSYDSSRTWGGLSPFGEKAVLEMKRLGMMVDVSHVSDETFWDILEISDQPVIDTHSSCRAFTPGFQRNSSDRMIKAIAEKGGMIMINFGSTFIDSSINAVTQEVSRKMKAEALALGLPENDPKIWEMEKAYYKDHPIELAHVKDVAMHIQHAVKIAGIDHVGIGSDFEGLGKTLPFGLKDVSDYPELVFELLKLGFSDKDIKKILGENFLNFWEKFDS